MDTQINLNLLAKSEPKQTIREHTDALLNNANTLKNIYHIDEKIYHMLEVACEFHDYGKYNKDFQNRLVMKKRFDPEKEIPHAFLSMYFVDKNCLESKEDYFSVCYAILYHHKSRGMGMVDIRKKQSELVSEKLIGVQHFEITTRTFQKILAQAQTKNTILVKGLLHRCDHAASAAIPVEIKNDFLEQKLDRFLARLQQKDPVAQWNEMQKYCRKNQKKSLIIVATTGMGKTEAALNWIGDEKGIYILPLRSAINGIYDRLEKDILERDKASERLALLHSDNLSYLAEEGAYLGDLLEYGVRAKQWAMPLTISTPDQLFDFVFKVNGYENKLATAVYSKIIIDEIQAYDATLLAYIITGIHQIMNLGGKVAIFTATLPPFVRELLLEQQEMFIEKTYIMEKNRHNVKVMQEELSADRVLELADIESKKSPQKILIICNTVKKSQQIFEELRKMTDIETRIIHAKFTKQDRRQLEQAIKEDGKTECKKNIIWVGTSVVEASLDIDFDILFTELSELSGLFQRFGRCNRKGAKSIEKNNCFVFTEIDKGTLNKRSGGRGFIDQTLYELSKRALQQWNGIMSEQDKQSLLEENFTTENLKGSSYMMTYKEACSELEWLKPGDKEQKELVRFRDIQSKQIIPERVFVDNKERIYELRELWETDTGKSMRDKEDFWVKKLEARNEILDYTVNIGYYDSNLKIETIKLGKEEIDIVKCIYDESGYKRMEKEKGEVQGEGMFM